jgi:hypothetical protein
MGLNAYPRMKNAKALAYHGSLGSLEQRYNASISSLNIRALIFNNAMVMKEQSFNRNHRDLTCVGRLYHNSVRISVVFEDY